ncbi:DUF1963 domain-containing protein [Croceicoccus gelatinilyticus]|uniref:DUF1963 domain-containing protein n=1 Tax=Croceicoccus gelatinilyticus TaxID=2835536 RepID=UPI001BD1432F|nr:DUF1963 domain-containing protein [Croceicoccus gelatinilyticus]MBS7668569.1 DUF1963 domain-containing protein [Croceicoccus gelatinilyticus]
MKQAGSVRIILIATIVAGSIVALKTALPQIPLSTTILASCIGLALIFLLYRSEQQRRREEADSTLQTASAPMRDLNPASIRERLENRPLPQVSPPPMARDMQGAMEPPAYASPAPQPAYSTRPPEPPVLELVGDFAAEEEPVAEAEAPVLELSPFDEVVEDDDADVLDLNDYGEEEGEVEPIAFVEETPQEPVVEAVEVEEPVEEALDLGTFEEPGEVEPAPEYPTYEPVGFADDEEADEAEEVLDLADFSEPEAEPVEPVYPAYEPLDFSSEDEPKEEILDLSSFEEPEAEPVDLVTEEPAEDVLDLASFEAPVETPAEPEYPTYKPVNFSYDDEDPKLVSFESPEPEATEEPVSHGLDWSNFEDFAATGPAKPMSLVPSEDEVVEEAAEAAPTFTPTPETAPASSPIEAARGHAIVFREAFPPAGPAGLSFYGGSPVAPADFAWPRAMTEAGDIPLTFVMQWDCAKLAVTDPTDLLPRDGAMYLFMDLDWSRPMAYRFIHVAGNGDGWGEVATPGDLAPAYGSQAIWAWPICAGEDHDARGIIPRRLPHWPFEPVGMTLGTNETKFWQADDATHTALSRLDLAPAPAPLPRGFERPYPAFPHDWSAVRTVCAWLLGQMRQPEQPAELTRWLDETRMLYAVASREEPFDPIPQLSANEMWGWMEQVREPLEPVFQSLVSAAVNTTIGAKGKAMEAIPAERIAAEAGVHRLSANPQASVPNRMFGTPSYVQGEVGQFVEDEVLLLEIGGNDTLGHFFGTGVLQFTIAPDDLTARNFDRVRMTVAAA